MPIAPARLVDTDVFSFGFRQRPLAARYRPHLHGHQLYLSFMSVAELYALGTTSAWGPGLFARLSMALRRFTILPSSDRLCRKWAEVRHQRRTQSIGVADAWIAATALDYGLELITHNARDFSGVAGLRVITEPP